MTKARDLANIISGGFTEADIPNLSASKITSGTFADARIAASNVSQHAQSFDDNKIVNDISTLGLRVHTQENLNASNSNSASFDVFQDSSAVSNLVTCARDDNEFMSSVVSGTTTITMNASNYLTYIDPNVDGNLLFTKYTSGRTSNENRFNPSGPNNLTFNSSSSLNPGNTISTANEPTLLGYMFGNESSTSTYIIDNTDTSASYRIAEMVWKFKDGISFRPNGTIGFKWMNGSGNFSYWELRGINHAANTPRTGASQWGDDTIVQHSSSVNNGSSYTLTASQSLFYQVMAVGIYHGTGNNSFMWNNLSMQGDVIAPVVSATGSFTGNNITASSSTNKMGAVITYQDNAGTNALNTDIVLQLSADGGSNYSTATMTALPDFATGIKMAKVNDLSVTAGTSLKYKISFANQASGSKEARIRGVSLQY